MTNEPDHVWVAQTTDRFAFHYRDGRGHIEGVALETIARAVETPTYVYSAAAITRQYEALADAVGGRPTSICYAVKANSAQAILKQLAGLGAGADIVSGGELERALAAGIAPDRIVFSGVGKRYDEIDRALAVGVFAINVESTRELERVAARAVATGSVARVALRINPDVDPATHPYLATGLRESKFGIANAEALAVARAAANLPGIRLAGLACHIGSQIVDAAPFVACVARMRALHAALATDGVHLDHLDLGGGLGIPYRAGDPELDVRAWGRIVVEATRDLPVQLVLEPGRFLVGNAGLLLTRVVIRKPGHERCFVVVDAAMNDLLRPALYGAYHAVVPVVLPDSEAVAARVDVVGPICESGDFLAQDRWMSGGQEDDLLAVLSTGAYGAAMASDYNTRPRAAEVLVDGDRFGVIRPRGSVQALMGLERDLP